MSVPLRCQKQPTMTDNHVYSRGIHATAELPVPVPEASGDNLIRMRSVVQVHLGPPAQTPSPGTPRPAPCIRDTPGAPADHRLVDTVPPTPMAAAVTVGSMPGACAHPAQHSARP